MVGVSCSARAALSGTARILRPMVIRRTICSGCGRRWEEACLSTSFVGSLVHLGFDIGWLSNRVGQLDDQIIIKVVLIRRLRLLRDTRSYNFAFDALSATGSSRRRNRGRRTRCEAALVAIFNGMSLTAVLGHL